MLNMASAMAATTLVAPASVITPSVVSAVDSSEFNSPISANMCGVDIVIRRPSGKIKVKELEVQAPDRDGVRDSLDTGKVTKPHFIIDGKKDHALWRSLDENARQIDRVLSVFSVNDVRRGFHLVPMGKVGQMLVEFRRLREERRYLAMDLRDKWHSEVIPQLRSKFGNHWYLLECLLPEPSRLVDRFDVVWTLSPLTPLDPGRITFSAVNDIDRQQIIDESNRMVAKMMRARARAIYNEVFGTALRQCQEIAAGGFATGKRKTGAIQDLIDLVQRMRNFSEFATPEVLARADEAMKSLDGVNIQLINNNQGRNSVTRSIQAAFAPLETEITKLLRQRIPEGGKSGRSLGL